MAVIQLAFQMNVSGTGPGEFFYTQPAVMTLKNAIHVAINCISLSGGGTPQIKVWVQTSDDLEYWPYLGGGTGSPPPNSLFTFSALGAQQNAVAISSGDPNYAVSVGGLWVRFVFRVTSGSAVSGNFAVRVNTFAS